MNHHKQNYSNIGNSHTLNQHFESSGVAVLSFYYMYRILARPRYWEYAGLSAATDTVISVFYRYPPFTLRYGLFTVLFIMESWRIRPAGAGV